MSLAVLLLTTPLISTAMQADLLPGDVVFREDEVTLNTLRPRKEDNRSGCRLGPRDRNSVHIGKHVLVINKSQWKGYKGIIKSTSPDGFARVELQATLIAHQRTQVIRLDQLAM